MRLTSILTRALVIALGFSTPLAAQNFASGGSAWSGGWGFRSANDRNVALSQAQTIRNAEENPITSSQTYNTTNDNRNNYVDVASEGGAVNTDFQNGDVIGENTYAVGSLNTGNTTVTTDGDGNTVEAVNSAETNGCTDASILNVVLDELSALPGTTCGSGGLR